VSGLAKTLAQLIKVKINSEDFAAQVREVPELMAAILAANVENAELVDGVRCLFDHKSRLYQYHGLSDENAILLASSGDHLPSEEREWRQGLGVGSKLDALKVDAEQKVSAWSQGIVKARAAGDKVQISFPDDSHLSDRELSIYSAEIAAPGAKSQEELAWRGKLEAGDRVDCFDSTGSWYACTVLALEAREYQGSTIDLAHIAFRVAHPEGDKADAEGDRFYGWDDKFDEWMPRSSARL